MTASNCSKVSPPESLFVAIRASGDCTADPVALKPGRSGTDWAAILADDWANSSSSIKDKLQLYAVGTDSPGAQCAEVTLAPLAHELRTSVRTFTSIGELSSALRRDRPPYPFVVVDVNSYVKALDGLGVDRKLGSSDSYTQYRSWDTFWNPETGVAPEGAIPLVVADREQREQLAAQEPPQRQYKPVPQRIAVPGNLQATNLITKIEPDYPPSAKATGVQGDVKFEAVIGKDGRVVSLKPVSGDPLLTEAARAAVSKWVYRPTSLAGEPVEVVTQIVVAFRF